MKTRKTLTLTAAVIAMFAGRANNLQAASVDIPNASFESPETVFVDINIDSWQMPPKPFWYDESGGNLWSQLTGVFLNLPPEDPDRIDNCDGNQAAWFFALPEVELFQDLAATFEVGKSYHLTAGIIAGGGNMKDGVAIEIRLYYRDAENKKVTAGATTYTYDAEAGFVKHLIDVRLDLPPVVSTDPWAGRNIGVQFVPVMTLADLDPETGKAGGYWDLDNVRLTESVPGVDFTGDSFVDLQDFAVMAGEWLSCTETTTDQTGDGCVTFDDLRILLEFWLELTSE